MGKHFDRWIQLGRAARRAYIDVKNEFEANGGMIIQEPTCTGVLSNGSRCKNHSGFRTSHDGWGVCWRHGGNTKYERARGAWLMAHAVAKELDISPWECLFGEVRRSAGEVAFYDAKVAQAPSDDALLGEYSPWVKKWEESRKRLARAAKLAIDAGVAERLVAQVEENARTLNAVLMATLSAPELELSDSQIDAARGVLRRELLALGSSTSVVDSEAVEDATGGH